MCRIEDTIIARSRHTKIYTTKMIVWESSLAAPVHSTYTDSIYHREESRAACSGTVLNAAGLLEVEKMSIASVAG